MRCVVQVLTSAFADPTQSSTAASPQIEQMETSIDDHDTEESAVFHCRHCHGNGMCPDRVDQAAQTTTQCSSRYRHDVETSFGDEDDDAVDDDPVLFPSPSCAQYGVSPALFGRSSPFLFGDTDMASATGESEEDHDPAYFPGSQSDSAHDHDLSEDDSDVGVRLDPALADRKYVVWSSHLDELFKRCGGCGQPVLSTVKRESGTLLIVKTTCVNEHTCVWESQPSIGRGAARSGCGSWLFSAAILLCGGLFTTFSLFAKVLNVSFISARTFYHFQASVVCPVVNKAWMDHVLALHTYLEGETVKVSGDARCDSPGYSAKYGK